MVSCTKTHLSNTKWCYLRKRKEQLCIWLHQAITQSMYVFTDAGSNSPGVRIKLLILWFVAGSYSGNRIRWRTFEIQYVAGVASQTASTGDWKTARQLPITYWSTCAWFSVSVSVFYPSNAGVVQLKSWQSTSTFRRLCEGSRKWYCSMMTENATWHLFICDVVYAATLFQFRLWLLVLWAKIRDT